MLIKKRKNKKRKDKPIETSIDKEAKAYFCRLEQGEPNLVSQWEKFRQISLDAYKNYIPD